MSSSSSSLSVADWVRLGATLFQLYAVISSAVATAMLKKKDRIWWMTGTKCACGEVLDSKLDRVIPLTVWFRIWRIWRHHKRCLPYQMKRIYPDPTFEEQLAAQEAELKKLLARATARGITIGGKMYPPKTTP